MYKVFINNLPVFLASSIDEVEADGPLRYADCSSLEAAHKFIEERLNKFHHYGIALIYHDVDQLYQWCFGEFKFIEAAGGVVRNDEGKYLFIFRKGKWDLPKGKLEKKEKIEQGAIREVTEECGITDVKIATQLEPTWHVYELKDGTMVIKVTYWFLMDYSGDEKLIPQTEEGITKVEWRAADELDDIFENTYWSILDVIIEGLELS